MISLGYFDFVFKHFQDIFRKIPASYSFVKKLTQIPGTSMLLIFWKSGSKILAFIKAWIRKGM